MEASEQRRIIEALILASSEPITAARLAQIVPECTPGVAKDRVNELNTEYQEQDRAFEIWEVAGGYQIRTRAEFSGYLQQLRKERPLRLSRAALETLSIIAYKQPVTRGELEHVRGVDCGATLKSLLDRRLIKIVGHREVPGRPMLYGTSKRFLEVFGLESVKSLPTLRELEELAREQGIELPGAVAAEDEPPPQAGGDSGAAAEAAASDAVEAAAGGAAMSALDPDADADAAEADLDPDDDLDSEEDEREDPDR